MVATDVADGRAHWERATEKGGGEAAAEPSTEYAAGLTDSANAAVRGKIWAPVSIRLRHSAHMAFTGTVNRYRNCE